MITIPVLDANDSLLEIALEANPYFVRMSWNSEGEFWVLGLEDYAHNLIIAGIRVVPDTLLLPMWRHLPVPPGELAVLLMDDTRQDIRRTDFADGSAVLVYSEEGEDVAF